MTGGGKCDKFIGMKEIEKSERRKFVRFHTYHLAKYRPLLDSESKTATILSSLRDIGGGGVCLRAKEKLPLSSVVQLTINFPQLPEPIICKARVVWVKRLETINQYELGLQFLEISDAWRQEIMQRIDFTFKKIRKP